MAPAINLSLCSLQACDGKMAYMLMAVLVVALHQLAPAHAASPVPVPEAAPSVETAPPAAVSNSIFQQLAATAASRRAGTAIGIRSGEEAAAPAEEEAALSPRSHRDPCCQLRFRTADCHLQIVQQHVPHPACEQPAAGTSRHCHSSHADPACEQPAAGTSRNCHSSHAETGSTSGL